MRRPLGNGMPFQITDDVDPPVSVVLFDATALDPNQVWQVTAYAWPALNGSFLNAGCGFRISLVTGGVGTLDVVNLTDVAAAALFTASLLDGKAPKVLDKITLRGNQQLVLRAASVEALTLASLAVYGYFEMNSTDPLPYDFRPLEPAPLVAPFNAAPTVLNLAAAGTAPVYATAHLLSPTYADCVTLTANFSLTGGGYTAPLSVLRFPNGVQLPLNRVTNVATPAALVTLLEDIPLLAPSATNNALQIGFVTGDAVAALTAASWGHFTRVS